MSKGNSNIVGFGSKKENLEVQKSRYLLELWSSTFSLNELKILDLYLSRINSHDPERRIVVLEKGEIENIMGVDRIKPEVLNKQLKHLMQPITLPTSEDGKSFKIVNLFEEAECTLNKDGKYTLSLECTHKALEYFFNIERIGYIRYKLQCILPIKSIYSYFMFCYLENNRFRGTWDISIDELKKVLRCQKEEYYDEYKNFNRRILKKVQEELEEKSGYIYEYQPLKKGYTRSYTHIQFKIISVPAISESVEDIDLDKSEKFWALALEDFNFTKEELTIIHELLRVIPEEYLPEDPSKCNSMDNRFYHYLKIKVAVMDQISNNRPIKHKFNYLCSMIKNDAKRSDSKSEPDSQKPRVEDFDNVGEWYFAIQEYEKQHPNEKKSTKKSGFMDFKQQDYDFDALRKAAKG